MDLLAGFQGEILKYWDTDYKLGHTGQAATQEDKDYLFFRKFLLFAYFWLSWVSVAVSGLSLTAASQSCSLLRCAGLS